MSVFNKNYKPKNIRLSKLCRTKRTSTLVVCLGLFILPNFMFPHLSSKQKVVFGFQFHTLMKDARVLHNVNNPNTFFFCH